MTDGARSRRGILISVLGIVAVATLSVFAWRLATRKGVVDQLVEILCAEDLPDAVWAFETLKQLDDRDMLDLLPHVDETRPTPLRFIYFSSPGGSNAMTAGQGSIPAGEVCRCVLGARLDIGAWSPYTPNFDSGQGYMDAPQIRAAVEAWLRSDHGSNLALEPSPGSPTPQFFTWNVHPPSRDPVLRRVVENKDVGALLDLMTGTDAPAAHWAYEVIQSLPDADLDQVVPRLHTRAATTIHGLHCDWPGGAVGAGQEAVDLTSLLSVALAKRTGSADLQSRVTGTVFHPTTVTLDAVEAAWRAHLAGAAAR